MNIINDNSGNRFRGGVGISWNAGFDLRLENLAYNGMGGAVYGTRICPGTFYVIRQSALEHFSFGDLWIKNGFS